MKRDFEVASHRQFLEEDGLCSVEWFIEAPAWEENGVTEAEVWIDCTITDGQGAVCLTRPKAIEALIASLETCLREHDRAQKKIAS